MLPPRNPTLCPTFTHHLTVPAISARTLSLLLLRGRAMSDRCVSRSPRVFRGMASTSAADRNQRELQSSADILAAVRAVQRTSEPDANDIIRIEHKLAVYLRSLNDYNDRVRRLTEDVDYLKDQLAKHRAELDTWQRWWETYGESMAWYFYYRYYYEPQPMSFHAWCKKQQHQSRSQSSADGGAWPREGNAAMLVGETEATSTEPAAAAE